MNRVRWPYVLAAMMVIAGFALGGLSLRDLGAAPSPSAPSATPGPTAVTPSVSSDVTPLPTVPTPALAPTVVPMPTPRPTPQTSYVVQSGDTLLGIALRYDVAMARIQIENSLGEGIGVRIGQTLVIPARALPDEQAYWRARVVKPGDTLLSISAEADVNVAAIDRVNGLNGSNVIRAGAVLIIPTTGPAAPAPTTAALSVVAAAPSPTVRPVSMATATPSATFPFARVAAPATPSPTPAAAVSSGSAETQLLTLYNQARAAAGVPPLRYSAALETAARAHAQDCATRGFGSHVGSDGADTKTRITRAGYTGAKAWGENWAWARSAIQAWDMWFTQEYPSGPHRDNILSARYTEVGFGVIGAQGGFYYIADFGSR